MRRMMIAAILAAGTAMASWAEEIPAIPGVIQSQIDAFLKDDFAAAFTFASPMIQGMFGNAANFGTMVRQGYPMVWRPADVRFLEQKEPAPGRHLQNVMMQDAAGRIHVLEYEMIQIDGNWRINGVRILETSTLGA